VRSLSGGREVVSRWNGYTIGQDVESEGARKSSTWKTRSASVWVGKTRHSCGLPTRSGVRAQACRIPKDRSAHSLSGGLPAWQNRMCRALDDVSVRRRARRSYRYVRVTGEALLAMIGRASGTAVRKRADRSRRRGGSRPIKSSCSRGGEGEQRKTSSNHDPSA